MEVVVSILGGLKTWADGRTGHLTRVLIAHGPRGKRLAIDRELTSIRGWNHATAIIPTSIPTIAISFLRIEISRNGTM